MILVLFGQPHSGKSTIANEILKQTSTFVNIDGDKLRELFANKDYSKEGRIKNLNRASDIAHFLNSTRTNVILSLVYPYKEAREYLNGLTKDILWVYLHYNEERGREKFHVQDFEEPIGENVLSINTSQFSLGKCLILIDDYIKYQKRS
jgi:adenylylsulfate kinase-like enzyme